MRILKQIWELLRDTYLAWCNDGAQALAAALSYYALFSLAPLLIIVVAMTSLVFGPAAAELAVSSQMQYLVGADAASAVQEIVVNATRPRAGIIATIIGAATVLLGASAVFGQLQHALNQIWRVHARPPRGLRYTLRTRSFSLGMILGAGFLLLVSLLINASVAALNHFSNAAIIISSFWQWMNLFFSVVIGAVLFGVTFQFLPNLKLTLGDVWIGAILTSVLFNAGKVLIGLYLGRSSLTSTYGAAGSLVVIMVWVYYSAQILFFGAEFTKVYTCRYGTLVPRPPQAADGPVVAVDTASEIE